MRNLLIIFLFLCSLTLSAQYSSNNKKALKRFEKAINLYEVGRIEEAYTAINSALKADKKFIEAYLLKAQILYDQQMYKEEADEYQKALEVKRDYSPKIQYLLSTAYYNSAQYDLAYETIQEASQMNIRSEEMQKNIDDLLNIMALANELYRNPVPFEPVNLGENVNSPYDDYWPMITANGTQLYTTKNIPIRDDIPYDRYKNSQEDFYVNRMQENGTWSRSRNLGEPLNTLQNEGAPSISADGKTLVYTACNREDGLGRCDLYISRKIGNSWTTPQNMGAPINTAYIDRQPSLSPDGNTLYFASNRKGTSGMEDLWYSTFDGEKWSVPNNLGDSINTDGIEWSPFMHPDNQTLYFVSNGHPGMGGLDIFKSTKINDSTWTKAVNIGYPINTNADEQSFFVNVSGALAYISSDRANDGNGLDIYSFKLHSKARPNYVSYIEGIVSNQKTKKPLSSLIQLIDIETGKVIMNPQSDAHTGEYLLCLPPNKNYMLNISKAGFLPYSDHFSLSDKHRHTPLKKNIELFPIEMNASTVLKNIFFETASYQLKPESELELNKLVIFLKMNKTVKIELGGHTDNEGKASYNQTLSENRAKAVYQYLINHQIESTRLNYKGYGLSKPIDTNDTEEGRANNRRTEFKIIGL